MRRVLRAATLLSLAAACSSGGALKPDGGDARAGTGGAAGATGAAGSTAGTTGGAGTTAPPAPDGSADGVDGGPPCKEPASFDCAQQSGGGGSLISCHDNVRKPVCDSGVWKCQGLDIDSSMCTCWSPAPPGCWRCTAQGWACDDAGTDVRPEAGADGPSGDARDAADASKDACDVGCTPTGTGGFCQQGEVQWECGGQWDFAAFNAACRDPATNLQRYCCPPSFLAACH